MDPLFTYYSHWVVEDGGFRTVSVIASAKSGTPIVKGESVARSRASENLMTIPKTGIVSYKPAANKTDFQAVILGPSRGWMNYRHQSDALAVYTLLRENGVPDNKIILMLYDDVPFTSENPIKGDIHNVLAGKNLRSGAGVDYSGEQVTPLTLKQVLLGNKTKTTPVVLESGNSTDVFVYIASHGEPGEIDFSTRHSTLSTSDFRDVTETMYREGRYRQIVFFVDTCFGESIGINATVPGLLYLTAAAKDEPSLGTTYDASIRQWLSDEFTESVLDTIQADPDITFRELYTAVYEKVIGSHARILNTENFGNIDIPVKEFLQP